MWLGGWEGERTRASVFGEDGLSCCPCHCRGRSSRAQARGTGSFTAFWNDAEGGAGSVEADRDRGVGWDGVVRADEDAPG